MVPRKFQRCGVAAALLAHGGKQPRNRTDRGMKYSAHRDAFAVAGVRALLLYLRQRRLDCSLHRIILLQNGDLRGRNGLLMF